MQNYEVHFQVHGRKQWRVVEACNREDARFVLRDEFPSDVVYVLDVFEVDGDVDHNEDV